MTLSRTRTLPLLAATLAGLAALSAALPASGEGRNAVGGGLIAVQALKDKCYNTGPNGTRTEVKCPDVIVAKPNSGSSSGATPSRARRDAVIAARLASARRSPAASARFQGRVPIRKGTYTCYNENPPNSGHFDVVTCPDEIVLDTND